MSWGDILSVVVGVTLTGLIISVGYGKVVKHGGSTEEFPNEQG